MQARFRGHSIPVADRRAFNTTSYFKEVVIANMHWFLPLVNKSRAFFNDIVRSDEDRPAEGKYECLGVDNGTGTNGDIALEFYILAD